MNTILRGDLPATPADDTESLDKRLARLSPDKRALLEQLVSGGRRHPGAVPRTPHERILARIWTDVFGLKDVGTQEDFFDLGGDSIVSIQIVAKARQHGLLLTVRDLFEHPTIAQLASFSESRSAPDTGATVAGNHPPGACPDPSDAERRELSARGLLAGVDDVCALSPVQQGMLYHIEDARIAGTYFEQTLCTLRGHVDVHAFRRAWQAVVDRHPALRTSFVWEQLARPMQRVHASAALAFTDADWSSASSHDQDAWLEAFLQRDLRRGFDLRAAPLMRLALFRVAPQEYRFVWSCSHLIIDAGSLPIVLRQVVDVYRGAAVTDAPGPSFADCLRWRATSANPAAEAAFWRSALQGCGNAARSPAKSMPPAAVAAGSGRCERVLAARWNDLLPALRAHRITVSTLAQAAWARLLMQESGRAEALFGMVFAGRPTDMPNAESIVGSFVNTLPVRVRSAGDGRVIEWLNELQRQQLALSTFASTSLAEVRGHSGLPPEAELLESVLVLFNEVGLGGLEMPGWTLEGLRVRGQSNCPLVVRLSTLGPARLEALYHLDSYSPVDAMRLLEAFESQLFLLADLVARPAQDEGSAPSRQATSGFQRTAARPVRIARSSLAEEHDIAGDGWRLPVCRGTAESLDACDWLEGNLDLVRDRLATRGGVLLRGFQLESLQSFERLAASLCSELMSYRERSTPRSSLGGAVYSSTEYPASEGIALHNEFSYALRWPRKILFHCVRPADEGGQTPIAHAGLVHERIPEAVRSRFESRGVMYLRNIGAGVDLDWQEVFQAKTREEVEAHCRQSDIEFEWLGNVLRTRQRRHAVTVHPATGETVWFNQAHLFHMTNLAPALAASLQSTLGEEGLPRNARYGDGSPIPAADLDAVREAYRRSEIVFDWAAGDVLILDNMLVAHGRRPFEGHRNVTVCMGEPHDASGFARVDAS